MAYGDKPKRQKDDMGNKGRRSGKGPKPMKGAKKANRESAKQERKNLKTENPVVNRSNDSGFDYTQSKKDIKKRYKKMDKGGSAPAAASIPHGSVSRFVGSTKPLGNTKAMNAMMKKTIEKGLAADLGTRMAKAAVKSPIASANKLPSMTAEVIKPGPEGATGASAILDAIGSGPLKTTGSFKPSERDMALKEAHLGKTPPQQSASPSPLTMKQAKGPKPQKPKSKSQKPKGKPKYTKSETVKAENKVKRGKRGKRTIKAKF